MKPLITRPTQGWTLIVLFSTSILAADLMAADVKLTGILALPEKKRALLLVREPGSSKTCTLGEGQREGAVEVLKIDEKAGLVKIRNGDKEVELTFESDGVPLTASQPRIPAAAPAASPMALMPAPVHNVPMEAMEPEVVAPNPQVVVIGRNTRRAVPQRTGIISPNNNSDGQAGPMPLVTPWRPPPPANAQPVDNTPLVSAPPSFQYSQKTPVLEQSPFVAPPVAGQPPSPPPAPSSPGSISSAGTESVGQKAGPPQSAPPPSFRMTMP